MFSPSAKEASIYVSRRRAIARIWRRRMGRVHLLRELRIDDLSDAISGAEGILAAVSAADASVTRCSVYVGAVELRIGLIERKPGVASRRDWLALASKKMLVGFGLDADAWKIGVDLLPGARLALAAAAKRSLIERIETRASAHGLQVTAVLPLPIEGARRIAQRSERIDALSLAERDAVTTFVDCGGTRAVYTVMSSDGARDLEQELVRSRLLLHATPQVRLRAFLFDDSTTRNAANRVTERPSSDFGDLWRECSP